MSGRGEFYRQYDPILEIGRKGETEEDRWSFSIDRVSVRTVTWYSDMGGADRFLIVEQTLCTPEGYAEELFHPIVRRIPIPKLHVHLVKDRNEAMRIAVGASSRFKLDGVASARHYVETHVTLAEFPVRVARQSDIRDAVTP